MTRFSAAVLAAAGFAALAAAQSRWDPGKTAAQSISEQTGGRLKMRGEFRSRLEARTGVGFGRDPEIENPLFRTRVGMEFQAAPWLKLVGLTQDCRAPLYGRPAPASARDTLDLHEGYLEFFPERKRGFGAILGRQMVSLGEGRILGISNWSNTSRTYDTARFYYRLPNARLELLLTSFVKPRIDEFNRPGLGDRLWGTYNSFSDWVPKGVVEIYAFRRHQNRPGGFSGTGRLKINTLGVRVAAPLAGALRYSIETAVQSGKVGDKPQRGFAWFSNLSRTVNWGRPLNLSIEYKYASGTGNPEGERTTTFDQLYASNHDKFGHADLLGWRNIHNLRSLNTLRLTKGLALNVMYNNSWLASPRDALYNGQGRAIAQAPKGDAGRHVGQELDLYATHQWGSLQFGAGFAHLFAGEFLKKTTPGVNTRYLYVFQSYTF
jgi:Alginate export